MYTQQTKGTYMLIMAMSTFLFSLFALGLRPGSYGSSTAQAITFHPACSLAHNNRRAGDCSSP
jgi:hypothetical protein